MVSGDTAKEPRSCGGDVRRNGYWDGCGGVCGHRRYVSVGSDGGHSGGGEGGGENGCDGRDCDSDFSSQNVQSEQHSRRRFVLHQGRMEC